MTLSFFITVIPDHDKPQPPGCLLESPRIEANKLRGMPDCYKIKLRSSGYRLVYQVIDEKVVVFVISVGKRERSEVYSEAVKRIL